MRRVLAFVVSSVLAGCGDGPPGPAPAAAPQILVVASARDGEPPTQGLRVQAVHSTQGRGPEIGLVAVTGRPHVYAAPGATDGPHTLLLPEGWGHLIGSRLPYLQPGGTPARFVVGRSHTLYCASHVAGRALGDEWGVRRIEAGGVLGRPLAVRVEQDVDLGLTLLRFPREDWAGGLAYQGRFLDGSLTEMVQSTFKDTPRPVYRELDAEPLAPLRVAVVSQEPLADDALWTHLEVEGLPLAERQQRPVRAGRADFPGVPLGGRGIVVRLGDDPQGASQRFTPDEWSGVGELRLLFAASGRIPASWVPVEWSGDVAGLRVQARAASGDSYGLVPTRTIQGAHDALLPPGTWRLLVTGPAGVVEGTADTSKGPSDMSVTWNPRDAWASVQGLVTGGSGRSVVWRRREDGRRIHAHGWTRRADGGGRYRGVFPAGEYEVAVEQPDGTLGPGKKVVLEPGMQLSLPLDA